VNAVLLTAGDPSALTGGSLYHRRIAERASRFGVALEVRSLERTDDGTRAARDADVVVVDSLVAARVRPRGSVPVVASVHQRPGGLVGPWPARAARAALDQRLYRRADAVIVPSRFLRDTLVRAGVARDRVRVVEPGSDAVRARTARGDAGGPVGFLCIANLFSHKRPLDLVEAFSRLSDLDATLTLVGAPAESAVAERVRARLAGPRLAGRARWVGLRAPDEAGELLARADVFVLPALEESYGMAVAEALRAGVPAIVARSGNLPNLVREGEDGFVVAPRDAGALAHAMRTLATDSSLRAAMAASARSSGARLPSWDDAAAAFCAVLGSVQAGVASDGSGRRSAA
jgi:glycosyltransferase involved in cell wall biosynthesis